MEAMKVWDIVVATITVEALVRIVSLELVAV